MTEPRGLEEWPCRAGGQTPRAAQLVLLPQKLREEAPWGQGVGLLGWEVRGGPLLVWVFLRRCSGKKLDARIYCGCQKKNYIAGAARPLPQALQAPSSAPCWWNLLENQAKEIKSPHPSVTGYKKVDLEVDSRYTLF